MGFRQEREDAGLGIREDEVAAELGAEPGPWSIVVFEGLGWLLRGMVGAVGPSALCVVMTRLELVEGVGKSLGWSCGRESRYKALGRECIQ